MTLTQAGTPTLGTRVMSPWPTVFEVLGQARQYDDVEFLAEYAPADLHDLDNLCRAAELADLTPIIKIDQAVGDYLAPRVIGAAPRRVNPRAQVAGGRVPPGAAGGGVDPDDRGASANRGPGSIPRPRPWNGR